MKQASFYRNACVIASSLAVALCMFPVMSVAQEASLEEVIVTARKQEESLQDAPVTVSAFTEAAIEKRQAQSLDDIARFIPGLSFSKAFGRENERPVIRGLGNVLAGVGFGVESGAAYFIDGIYYPGDVQGLDLQDLERVEVIKGPQSALYGRNTYSGAINFITRTPAEELEARIKVRVAEHDESDVTFYIGGPINDTWSGGLSLRHYEKDGEWTNRVTEREVGSESTWSFSGVLDWTPTDNFHVRLRRIQRRDEDDVRPLFLQPATENNCFPGFRSLEARIEQGGEPTSGQVNNGYQYFCGEIKPRPVALNTGPDADGMPNRIPGVIPINFGFANSFNLADGTAFDGGDRRVNFNSLLVEYDFSSGYRVIFAGAYREEELLSGFDSTHDSVNILFSPVGEALFAITGRDNFRDYSAELRLESPSENPLRWTAGVFYYDFIQTQYDITFSSRDGNFDSSETVQNEAVFASVAYDFTDRLTGSVELRAAEETKSVREVGFRGEDDWNSLTPRVTLDYQLSDSILLYGVYSQGVKPGGINGSLGLTPGPDGRSRGLEQFDQEESDNYELGIKSQWWDNRLQANLAVFFIDAEDVQLTTPVDAPGAALNSIVTNQGSGEVFGVELDLQWLLTPDLTVGFNYALADTEFTEGCDDHQWTLTSGGGLFNSFDPSLSSDPPDVLSTEGFNERTAADIAAGQQALDMANAANAAAREAALAMGTEPPDPLTERQMASTFNNARDNAARDRIRAEFDAAVAAGDSTILDGDDTRIGDCSIDGNQFPLSSKHQASFFADYERTISGDMSVFAGVDVSYEDKKYVQVHNLAYVPDATIVGARIGLRWKQAELAIVGTNLTDEDAPILATRWLQLGTGNSRYQLGTSSASFGQLIDSGSPRGYFAPLREGRQIGVEFKYNF